MYLLAALIGQLTIPAALAVALAAQTTAPSPATAPAPIPASAPAPAVAPATVPAVATTAPAPTTAPTTALAITAAPATTAATAPATAPVLDQSSPKALLRSFFASRGEVDDATIRSLLHASNELEQKVLDSVVQIELANARLRGAEQEKLGKATTAPSVAARLEPASLSELDTFIEKVEGDRATVAAPRDPAVAMQFIKVGEQWKIPISSLAGEVTPAVAETMGAATRAQIEIIDGVTAEVLAGTLTSDEQVQAELSKRLAARIAATQSAPAPTATSPAPASPPAAAASQPAAGS